MKFIKFLLFFVVFVFCLSVLFMVSVVIIILVNLVFIVFGIISVSLLVLFNLLVICNIIFKGKIVVDGFYVLIDSVIVSGSNILCSVLQMIGLLWKLIVFSIIVGKVDGVGFKIFFFICGLSIVNGFWSNVINIFSVSNQLLVGNCKINSLSVKLILVFVVNL